MYSVHKGAGANIKEQPINIDGPLSQQGETPDVAAPEPVGEDTDEILKQEPAGQPVDTVIEEAKAKAQEIQKKAEAEIELQRKQFADEMVKQLEEESRIALEKGYIEGGAKKEKDIENAIIDLGGILQEIKEKFNVFIEEQKSDLFTVVLEVTQKILTKRLDNDDYIMVPIIQKALSDIKIKSKCIVTVSENAGELLSFLKKELKALKSPSDVVFEVAAKDMPLDFCTVEIDDSVLDISILNQLQNLENFFKRES